MVAFCVPSIGHFRPPLTKQSPPYGVLMRREGGKGTGVGREGALLDLSTKKALYCILQHGSTVVAYTV